MAGETEGKVTIGDQKVKHPESQLNTFTSDAAEKSRAKGVKSRADAGKRGQRVNNSRRAKK